jgi:hypothetical protein
VSGSRGLIPYSSDDISPRESHCCDQTDRDADGGQHESMAHAHPLQFARLCTQRQPDPDFARSLRDRIRDDAADADDPSTSAIAPAIASITSVKDARASDCS